MLWLGVFLAAGVLGGLALLRWGTRWGSTADERARRMPGDEYLEGGPRARVAMTRAVSISAPPERVWPWISQLGRGAGWYSVDWLDNGRKVSAWHMVSWIPEPRLGDATAIGYLRHIDTGRSVAGHRRSRPGRSAQPGLVSHCPRPERERPPGEQEVSPPRVAVHNGGRASFLERTAAERAS
jgi:hypothetical protein